MSYGYTNGGASLITAKQYVEEPMSRDISTVKKPGFFKRWLLKQLQAANDYHAITSANIAIKEPVTHIDQPERAIQFTIYNANGGRVIETRRYDRQKDRHTQNLYIVTGEQDFGRELDKIITMEALR